MYNFLSNPHSKDRYLFVSIPMSGKDEQEVDKRINDIYEMVCQYMPSHNWILLNTEWKTPSPDKDNKLYCLGRSIQELGKADFVVFADDWYTARGCRVEMVICSIYGFPKIKEYVLKELL